MLEHGVILTSPPDREKLVAEIVFGDDVWAVINHETGQFEIEILPHPKGESRVFPVDGALAAIDRAHKRLLGEIS